jgi:hypothetical protein
MSQPIPTTGKLCLSFLLSLFAVRSATAATTLPISVTGFNRDVVVENNASGPPFNSVAQNFNAGETTGFYQSGLPGKTHGLPAANFFTNSSDGTVLQFAAYTGNNALILNTDTGVTNGTLFLTTPRAYDRIAVVACSGNGDSTGLASLTLHFSDGSSFVTNYYAPDWFNNNSGALYTVALQGVERITLSTGAVNGAPTNPRFYQTTIALTNVPGGTNKLISSVTFGKASATTSGIFALSGTTNAFQSSVTFTPAQLTNLPATSLTTIGAVVNGQVLSTGNDAPQITIYYGPTDGGNNPAAWANSVSVGWQTGAYNQTLTTLAMNSTYYFTAKAVNAGGTSWASPSRSFATLAPSPPVVTNLPASSILANSASLNGQVLSTGGDTPVVTFFYGPVNGGNNPAAWSNNIKVGLQSAPFIRGAFGLSPSTTYYFTTRAVNAGGTSWASAAKSFVTLATNPTTPPVAVLTQHNDNSRTGDNLFEPALNTFNVNSNTFGLIYTRTVDDQIYAQPLVVTNVPIPSKGTHNIVIVATVNNSVYAFDADDPTVPDPYWIVSYLGPNIVAPANTDMTGACGGNYHDFSGNFGIVGTPVIDPVTRTMYLVARTKEFGVNYVQTLHALDITTGAELPIGPTIISATFGGVSFEPQHNNQRPALTLANGNIFIGWSSHCDWTPYHGWIMAYSASTLQQVAAYCDTPTGTEGGIWMAGQGPAADPAGNIYLSTGNGTVGTSGNPANTTNRAMSFLKLNGSTLSIMSWFTPYNYNYLNGGDWDLGSAGVMLIPGTNIVIGGGKSSSTLSSAMYVVNRDNMGGVSLGTSDTNILQSIPVTPTGIGVNHIHGAPVWWDGPDGSYTYVWGESDRLHQYKFNRATGTFYLPVYSQSPLQAWVNGMTGAMLAISANGTNAGSGILWASHQYTGDANQAVRPGVLRAFDAQNVTNELWNSEQNNPRDSVGLYAKFVPPTVANSKVYLATFSGRLNVYGLLPPGKPTVYLQPQDTTRFSGDTVTLKAGAGGTQPYSYQWMLNGATAIAGATSSAYTITNAQVSHSGAYSCKITNTLGTTNTASAQLTVVTAPTISYAQAVVGDHPVAYWRLDETSGSIAHDSWGGHDGQFNSVNLGLAGYNPNDPNLAAEFGTLASSDSYVGGITGIDFSTWANNGAFSIEAWVNGEGYSQANGAGIVTFGYGGGGEQFNLDTGNGGNFRLSVRDSINIAHNANSSVAPGNTWQHLVGVCDEPNGFLHLYVNGVDMADATISGGIQAGTSPISIGSRQSGYNSTYTMNFLGLIDEVSIYNYALTPAQVLNHYSTGTNPVARIYAQHSGSGLTLTWSPGILQSAPAITGPYTDMPSATSPFFVAPSASQQYYRVHVE